ncbi:GerAB/ArcD/ProY family transporter [Sporomusa sp.]|uniref:GerAB/ArcD/ProY family transporter n=1 Tax=Sporomusa sp. TaxID=2078658 RepID=UPI002CE26E6C|nr:GerAB/ArcD/ProY family transporter [Sporomusa sp.]HWR45456.1 GerAB/ArcD/ProY family transporter [Sporomusa sp.]
MGISEGLALVFLNTFPRIFLTRPAQTIEANAGLAWFAALCPLITILIPICLLLYVFKRIKGDIYTVTQQLLGKAGAWAVSIFLITMFLSDAALLLRQFAENTLLTALPFMEFNNAISWYTFNAVILCFLGIECIARTSYIILPFGVISLGFVMAALGPFYDINLLGPWQGRGISTAIQTGLEVSGINYGVLLLFVLGPAFQNLRTIKRAALFGLGGSTLLKSLSIFVFTLVFGTKVALEKTIPFFEMARLVYLNRYVQRVESLFIVLWVIAGIMSIAIDIYIAGYLITRIFNLTAVRPLIASLALLVTGAAMIPPDIASVIRLDTMITLKLHNAGLYGIPLLLFAVTLFKGRRKKTCTSA